MISIDVLPLQTYAKFGHLVNFSRLNLLLENRTKVYVLKLAEGKYYVGRTNQLVEDRFKEHQTGQGSAWTRKYPPIQIYREIDTTDLYREQNETLECMKQFGIDNVRGGPYTAITLKDETIHSIQSLIRHISDLCLRCGRPNHFQSDCVHAPKEVEIDQNGNASTSKTHETTNICSRCGRNSHLVQDCYATTHLSGANLNCVARISNIDRNDRSQSSKYYASTSTNLCLNVLCSRCGRNSHSMQDCYATTNLKGSPISQHERTSSIDEIMSMYFENKCYESLAVKGSLTNHASKEGTDAACSRCDRIGHSIQNCYATTHLNGSSLKRTDACNRKYDLNARESSSCCFRCGRSGHFSLKCYASWHINGSFIGNANIKRHC